MTRRDARLRRAFTLIEAIVAMVIIATMVPATLVLLHDAQVRRASPILADRARWLAAEKLEDIIADRHSTTRGWGYVTPGSYPAESPVPGFASFSRTVAIAETTSDLATAGTGYKRITVTVSWIDPARGPASFSLATAVADLEAP